MIATTTTTFPFLSSFHRPRLRPSCVPRRGAVLLLPARCSSSSWEEREDARWLREEQRWLREEQRWLREESRWRAERDALLAEIAALRLRVQEPLAAVDAVASPIPAHAVPAPSLPPAIAAVPPPRPALVEEVEVRKEVVVVEEKKTKASGSGGGAGGRRRTLRAGAEGEDVRVMQEALGKLGYYSGEEDMEFSSFSSGTERAVKTWQATLGRSEDGVMTSELLDLLLTGQTDDDVKTKGGINGAAAPAVTGTAEVQQTVVKENGVSRVQVSENRVFLLGENRWEDPSRLTQRNKSISSGTTPTKKCISCRGEGRLMCLECDGTGEPNIEPQFMEWIGEDTKCAYCEGIGSTLCDVCEGKAVVES